MGLSRHYLKEKNFMLTRLSGEINDQNLKEYLLTYSKVTKGVSRLRELDDCREIENLENLTVKGTTQSVHFVDSCKDCITAILVNKSSLLYGMARVFQMFLEEKRQAVKIFKDLDKALMWLARDEQEIEELRKFVKNG